MPYINRNKLGEIIGISEKATNSARDWIEPTAPEMVEFIAKGAASKDALTSSDNDMARILEDVIDVLLDKQLFNFTELPEAAQQKLTARRQLRENINSLEGLIVEDETIF